MKLIRTMFTALVLTVFFVMIGMVVVYAKADLNEIETTLIAIKDEYINQSTNDKTEETIDNTQNNSVSSSYIYTMPYAVAGTDDLLSYNNAIQSQSPQVGQNEIDDVMVYINENLIVSIDDVDYENVTGLSYQTIYSMMYDDNMDIWQIAMKNDKNILLKDVYSGYYSEMIIQMVNDEAITTEIADDLLVYVMGKLDEEICPTHDDIQEYIDSISEN